MHVSIMPVCSSNVYALMLITLL